MNKYNTSKLYTLSVTAIMSAISIILTFISIPIPFFPAFLKLDISEIPALIIAFSLGPWWGIMVEFIKSAIHILFSNSFGIGELANFLLNGVFILTAGIIYKYKKTRNFALLSMIVATVVMALISILINYYLLFPIYSLIFPIQPLLSLGNKISRNICSVYDLILLFIVPFNLLKGVLVSSITFLLYKKLSPIIKGETKNNIEKKLP